MTDRSATLPTEPQTPEDEAAASSPAVEPASASWRDSTPEEWDAARRPYFDNETEACRHCPTPAVHPTRIGGFLTYEGRCDPDTCERHDHSETVDEDNDGLDRSSPAVGLPDPDIERLQRIQDLQPNAVAYMRAHGFVMDSIGPLADDASELDRWKVLAFSLYSDLVEASVIAGNMLEAEADRALGGSGTSETPGEDA